MSDKPLAKPGPSGRFEKGNPGGGRPKGTVSLVSTLKRKLRQTPRLQDEIIQALVDSCKAGNPQSIKFAFECIDGPVKQVVEHSGPDGAPLIASPLAKVSAEQLEAIEAILDGG